MKINWSGAMVALTLLLAIPALSSPRRANDGNVLGKKAIQSEKTSSVKTNANSLLETNRAIADSDESAMRRFRSHNRHRLFSCDAAVIGDLNGDGVVSIADATLALRISVGLITATSAQLNVGDVAPIPGTGAYSGQAYGDGAITAADATRILLKAVGLISSFSDSGTSSATGTDPAITKQPASTVVTVGKNASLSVTATGETDLKYQWYKDDAIVNGATNSTYSVSSVATKNIGKYYVIVTDTAGSITSDAADLHVITDKGIWGYYERSGGTATETGQNYAASGANESGIWVTDSGALTLTNPTVVTSGASSSSDYSSFYGLNSGVQADNGGAVSITGGTVTTTGDGANGVFASGSGSTVTLSNVTIKATGQYAHGVMATVAGTAILTDVNISTAGGSSAPLATDRGGGTITATGGTIVATGGNSPGLYSTGTLNVTGSDITATGSEVAVIEGANDIILKDVALHCSKEDKWGAMIYQSMSGDAQGAKGVFTMTGGSFDFTASSGPLFNVTNTTAVITLSGVAVSAKSGVLLKAAAGSWGNSGSNGGTANLTADGQALTGDFVADSISSIAATLQNASTLTGTVNSSNQAKSVSLSLDATSQWIVTGDSHLSSLSDSAGISGTTISNIVGNGHSVTYDSTLSANSALGGMTYALSGGGTLAPK